MPNPEDLQNKTVAQVETPEPAPIVFTTMPRAPGAPTGEQVSQSAAKKFPVKLAIIIAVAVVVLGAGGYLVYAKVKASKQAKLNAAKQSSTNSQSSQTGSGNTSSGSSQTSQQSQIPDDWRVKYFGAALCANQDVCGDSADPSQSGLTNLEAYKLGIDPNNSADDGCGLANGDVVHVFNLDPKSCHTGGSQKYTDVDDLKSHFNSRTGKPFTDDELKQIAAKIKQYGLHTPTTATLDGATITFYTNYGQSSAQNGVSSTGSGTALDRDTQRSTTINQVSYALLKYKQANGTFPSATSFSKMFDQVKPLLAGQAVNPTDPTNVAPYVYTYAATSNGTDFSLTYYSETQSQAIVINAAQAQKSYGSDQANQRDIKRQNDLQNIANALSLYSSDNANLMNPTQHVYPTETNLQQALVPKYLTAMPLDPSTGQPYTYSVSADNASFSLQATLESPPVGKKGFLCTQDSCALY